MADNNQSLLEKELAKTDEEKIRDSKKLIYMGIPLIFVGIALLFVAIALDAGGMLMGLCLFVLVVSGLCVFIGVHDLKVIRENRRILEKQEQEQQERMEQVNRQAREGTWEFPSEEFYEWCREQKTEQLDSDFAASKARRIAEEILGGYGIEPENGREYLKTENLRKFLAEGKRLVTQEEEKELFLQKEPRDAKPTPAEETFLRRASEFACIHGRDKRIKLLSALVEEYDSRIQAMIEGEQALKQLGMIYAQQQKKESDWAVIGGIAEGIAGPAAGIMAASETMANNRKVREYNAAMRKASMDIMSGIPNMTGDRLQLEKERAKVSQQLWDSRTKVVLSKPSGQDIWKNMQLGTVTVKKNPSGVLQISLPVALKTPIRADVPANVNTVVDGVIRGEVWFEDRHVGSVIFPLPIYGIPCNMTEQTVLDGMCGRHVACDGEYTVKIGDHHYLWVMEA